MNKLSHKSLSLALFAGSLSLAACADPVGDAPRAEVKEAASTAAPAAAAAPEAAAAGPAAGTVRYAFSNEDGSKVSFVGAKVTQKHDGGFHKIKGTIDAAGGKLETAKVDVVIDMKSVYTDNPKLTGHLQSPDFFNVATFPTARFVSTSIVPAADGMSTVTGDLTLHGVTKQLSFPARVTLTSEAASAEASFGINRKDFGIVYPGAPDDLIHDEVLLKLDVKANPATAQGS